MNSHSLFIVALVFYGISILFGRRGRSSFFLGLIAHSGGLVLRTVEAGHPPFTNLYETLLFFSWSILIVYLFVELKYRTRVFCGLAFLLLLSASLLGNKYKEITPLVPALQSYWLFFHVAICFLAYAAFALSFSLSLTYLFRQEAVLDEIAYKSIAIGFVLLTLGIITGAVWAQYAWGSYWSWDPKETWALITWLIYALYLHLRAIGWRNKRSAYLSIIGFFAVIFTYLGVNFLLPGLHSYM
ncbi:MAG: cytochrome c biogenesis protein [bacterium]|nr:cytochrome c biogenesis protein [bacterium]